MTWQDILPQIILAIVAASPGIYAIWRGRHKEKADVAKIITEAAGTLVEEYKEKLESLERLVAQQQEEIRCLESTAKEQASRIDALEKEKERVLKGVEKLTEQIRKLGHEPVWEPNGKKD
jgi:uncharacterized protein HemX